MRINELHIGLRVKHPQHGVGTVKGINEQAAQIGFENGGTKLLDPGPLEPDLLAAVVQTEQGALPLAALVRAAAMEAARTLDQLETERREIVEQLGVRWRQGTVIFKPADEQLQAKDLPLERFFHKVVMVRDNLRLLEQKVNSHTQLADADKVDLQQYITRCYGSLTSFNILFKDKPGQFGGGSSD